MEDGGEKNRICIDVAGIRKNTPRTLKESKASTTFISGEHFEVQSFNARNRFYPCYPQFGVGDLAAGWMTTFSNRRSTQNSGVLFWSITGYEQSQ
jgi:hypothetical protein